MTILSSNTICFEIFIAGDLAVAKQICREHCFDVGLCVTIEPVSYIYTGGEEAGVRIGIINYPRFPSSHNDLLSKARVGDEINGPALPALILNRRSGQDGMVLAPTQRTSQGVRRMTPTPSKPDLVALAERLEKFQRVLESARRQDNKAISIWSDDPVVVAEAVHALRHLVSQPSLYEAGLRDEIGWLIEQADPPVYYTIHQNDYDEHWTHDAAKALRFARREDAQAYVDHIGWTSPPVRVIEHLWPALPVDGGDVEAHKVMTPEEYAAFNIQGWHYVHKDYDGFGSVAVSYGAPGPSEATPSTAGSVREALIEARPYIESHATENGTVRDLLNRIDAALSAPVEAPVAVKALIWPDQCKRGRRVHCDPLIGGIEQYCIAYYGAEVGNPIYRWARQGFAWSDPLHTYEAAKAAAQADYEQRIRSALIATERPLPSRDELERSVRFNSNPLLTDRAIDEQAKKIVGALLTLLGGSAHGR